MKRFALTLTFLCALGALAKAGTYSGKEVMQPAPPPCEWYRANEWDFNFWGTYAFPANTGTRDVVFSEGEEEIPENHGVRGGLDFDLGRSSADKFINRDDALGGGGDIKYFFSKYWGIGGEGFVLDCNDNIGGAGLFTFTFRWPIGCSRFAPYIWGGVGAVSGGTSQHLFVVDKNRDPAAFDEDNFVHRSVNNKHTEAVGQFGGGVEVRITRHVGFMGDFCWNAVQEDDNDFGMARFGVTLSY